MRFGFSQIKVVKQEIKRFLCVRIDSWLLGSRVSNNQRGFTLIELIMVMIIAGILAVVVAPRFFDANVFKSKGFADQVQATLRYAQKEAIAQRRYVCVALAASTITLTIGTTSACGSNLVLPTGATNTLSAPAGSGITLTYSLASFVFDALGRNTSSPIPIIISVSGATNNVVVETETGYVHSP